MAHSRGIVRPHLASLVEDFRRHGHETAVVAHRGNRRFATAYGELALLAGRFSAELDRRGIRDGERVVLWGDNSAEWIAVFFGCLLRGVLAVPLDAAGSADFANRVVDEVTPRLIVGDRMLLASLNPSVPQLYLAELSGELPPEPLYAVSDAVQADAPFQIVFTSGTTAEPKGIVLTHRNVLASLQPIENEIAKYRKYERWFHPLRFLHSVPLSHVFGQFMGLWIPALLAIQLHFGERLEPSRMTELIRRERISVLITVPRVLQLLRAHLLGRFLSLAGTLERSKKFSLLERWWHFRQVHRALGWKFWSVISGGAALAPDLEDFWNRLGFALIQGYGMTETTALITLNHPFHIRRGTIGKPLPGREVRINEDGELLVRGDVLAAGTWQGGAIHRRTEEWLATGDLASRDETGEMRFLGRKGEVIVTSAGMNVHPADLEEAMMQQPGVRGCCVVPCQTTNGPEPVAVALFSGSDEALHASAAAANRGLAEYQQIRRVLRWPDLQFPFTSTGKLLRRRVAQWVCAVVQSQLHGAVLDPQAGGDVLLQAIAGITGEPVLHADDTLRLSEDLHLDSLGRVQLQTELEQRLSMELPGDSIAQAETLGELRQMLALQHGARPAPVAVSFATGGTSKAAEIPAVQSMQSKPASPEHRYPRWPWSWPANAARVAFLELVMHPLVSLLGAPKVIPVKKKLPAGPVLIIANHVTAYDGPLVLYALPATLRRRVAIAMSGELLRDLRRGQNQKGPLQAIFGPAGYWLVTALFNVFPLPRLKGFQKSFEHAGEAMDRGYSVMVFPEGARSADGTMRAFRSGIGLLSQQSRVPVVPVALVGLGRTPSQSAHWFRTGAVEIRVGEAIVFNENVEPAERTARLEEAVRSLLGAGESTRAPAQRHEPLVYK
jgi:long-chain acyl-CoA synthetase